ncbi:MAG: hypothetical protein ABH862_02065 [Candidatus Omnitrophota bacterium]
MAVFAAGADIKNRSLFADKDKVYYGPDIGDLSDALNYEKYRKKSSILAQKTGIVPGIIVCDLHPNYFSTRFAKSDQIWFGKKHKLIRVQHHHAHIASVMYEHDLTEPVIGVSFDGTGYGTDGNIWGGEFLIVSKDGFERKGHLKYYMLPGGEKAVSEPWRMVLSILGEKGVSFLKEPKREEKRRILTMISKKINSPLTSSAGRLFDAAAALLGICEYAAYEAEGPIKLEALCGEGIEEGYSYDVLDEDECKVIDMGNVFLEMAQDIENGKNTSEIAAKFHNSMIDVIVDTVKNISRQYHIKDIALSGGVFQNYYLHEHVMKKLEQARYNVFTNKKTPINDLNISLGQYYAARHGDATHLIQNSRGNS